jgi:hypothetical protein
MTVVGSRTLLSRSHVSSTTGGCTYIRKCWGNFFHFFLNFSSLFSENKWKTRKVKPTYFSRCLYSFFNFFVTFFTFFTFFQLGSL